MILLLMVLRFEPETIPFDSVPTVSLSKVRAYMIRKFLLCLFAEAVEDTVGTSLRVTIADNDQ